MRASRANVAGFGENSPGKEKTRPKLAGFCGLVLAFGPYWRLFGQLYFFDLFLLFGVVVFPFLVVVLFVFVDFFVVGFLFFEFLVRLVGLIFLGGVFFLFVLVFLFFFGRIFFDVIFLVGLFRFVVFPGSFFRLVDFVLLRPRLRGRSARRVRGRFCCDASTEQRRTGGRPV